MTTQNLSSVPVDIVIPTRGRGALIDITIASIRQSKHTNFNLWIADQSDDDKTELAVAPHAEADERVHYIRTAPRGASIGRDSLSHWTVSGDTKHPANRNLPSN